MPDFIFLIGPGGAGKSTVGARLALKLGYDARDLDDEFCLRHMNIRAFISSQGYESYLEENAKLLDTLLKEAHASTVFILSSGFLATDIRADIVEANKKRVQQSGTSVLLMPSRDYQETLNTLVARQLKRGFDLKKAGETEKLSQRFAPYMSQGDIQIFSTAAPDVIANLIAQRLAERKH
ncbi:shikimate kinase [Enterobacter sp. Cy-643]|uniref:shikimate kinase n=1 Tax=Enterobacter sp. Cy-643 TaxID=2608346 RepID=UPI00141F7004|nr:shikimate kinase [Enterobacter sp. Cy-643]NIF31998.1 shikimate kinase [Enterobacter sp. Cy-643]